VNSKQQKTLEAIFANPTNGNLPWSFIENLLVAIGCRIIEGQGSSITVEKDEVGAYFHRPHPQKEALRYRVRDAGEFLTKIGVKP
jgi:hypothetical protein